LFAVISVSVSLAWGDPPTTQPSTPDASGRAVSPDGPRGRPGQRHRPNGRKPVELSEQQEGELLEALGIRFPRRREQLAQLKADHPDHYRRVLGRLWRWYEEWQLLPEEARETAMIEQELKIQAIHLVRKYRAATDLDEKTRALAALREVLIKRFKVSQDLREKRLAAMQAQIVLLRKENAERDKKRDEIIEEQLKRMLTSPRFDTDRPGPPDGGGERPTSQPAERD